MNENEPHPWERAPRREPHPAAYKAGAALAVASMVLMVALLTALVVWVWSLVL